MNRKQISDFITEKLKSYLIQTSANMPKGAEINPFAAPNNPAIENDSAALVFDRSTVFYKTLNHCVPFLQKIGIDIEGAYTFSMKFTCYCLGDNLKYGNFPCLQDKVDSRNSKLAAVLSHFDTLSGNEKSAFMNTPTNSIKRYKSQIEDLEQAIEVAENYKLKVYDK